MRRLLDRILDRVAGPPPENTHQTIPRTDPAAARYERHERDAQVQEADAQAKEEIALSLQRLAEEGRIQVLRRQAEEARKHAEEARLGAYNARREAEVLRLQLLKHEYGISDEVARENIREGGG